MSEYKISVNSDYVVPVPERFRDKKLRQGIRCGGLYIYSMTIKGPKAHDKRLIIKHRPLVPSSNDTIIIKLMGSNTSEQWAEFEGAELDLQYEANFITAGKLTTAEEYEFHYAKTALYYYLREYLLEQEQGKRIMEAIRIANRQIHEPLERADAPHSDKIIRETCERIKAQYKIVTIEESNSMLYYQNGVYVPGAEVIVKKEAQALFQYDMRNQLVNEIMGALQRDTYVSETRFDADLNIVNYADCLYNIKTKEVLPHRPEYLSRNQKPVKLLLAREEQHRRANNGSTYPRLYGRFVGGILYPKQIRTMIELFAYSFYRSNPHELYVNQWGYGGNGKGVNMAILKALHGAKNVNNIPLRKLITDKFATADLTGKDVNVDDETSSGTVTDNSILKKMTGNQPTWVQRKNKDPYETQLHCKFWFTCNRLPDVIDESDGRFRREITIIYPNKFVKNPTGPGEQREDPDIEDKIVKDELEMSRIANMCMDILHRILYQQNKRVHTDITTINERKRHLQIIKSPMSEFVEQVVEYVYIDSDKFTIYKDELYNHYLKFCKNYNIPPRDTRHFGEELLRIFGKDRLTDKRDSEPTLAPGSNKNTRRRYWVGLRLRDKWQRQQGVQTSLLKQGNNEYEENEDSKEE